MDSFLLALMLSVPVGTVVAVLFCRWWIGRADDRLKRERGKP
jgi:hypothetical protein